LGKKCLLICQEREIWFWAGRLKAGMAIDYRIEFEELLKKFLETSSLAQQQTNIINLVIEHLGVNIHGHSRIRVSK
jgi:hypothetical protein